MTSTDPLQFVDTKPYAQRLKEARKKLGMNDAVITAEGQLAGRPVVVCAMEFNFIGGSMGAVVGEKVTRGIELAIEQIGNAQNGVGLFSRFRAMLRDRHIEQAAAQHGLPFHLHEQRSVKNRHVAG